MVNELAYNHLERTSPGEQPQGRPLFWDHKDWKTANNMAVVIGTFEKRKKI